MLESKQLFLKPDEAKFLSMAVISTYELVEENTKNVQMNWSPESRRDMNEMLQAAKSLIKKLKKLGFDMRELPPYLESDNDEFFTKES